MWLGGIYLILNREQKQHQNSFCHQSSPQAYPEKQITLMPILSNSILGGTCKNINF